MIHVQSNSYENDEDRLDDERAETTKKSLQLLDDNNRQQPARSATPVYGDDDAERRVGTIDI